MRSLVLLIATTSFAAADTIADSPPLQRIVSGWNVGCTDEALCDGAMVCSTPSSPSDQGRCTLQCQTDRDCGDGRKCVVRDRKWNTCVSSLPAQVSWTKVDLDPDSRVTALSVGEANRVYVVLTPKSSATKAAIGARRDDTRHTTVTGARPPTTAAIPEARTMRWNGTQWDRIGRGMAQLATSSSQLFALDATGGVFRLDEGTWKSLNGILDDLTVDNFGLPVGTRNGQQWGFDMAIWHSFSNANQMKRMSFCAGFYKSSDGTDACWWGLGTNGAVQFQLIRVAHHYRGGDRMTRLYLTGPRTGVQSIDQRPGDNIAKIAALDWNNAWAVTTANDIYHWSAGGWDKQPGRAIDISVGADGTVYAISPEGDLYKASVP